MNEKQLRLATRFVATRDVKEYRATIPFHVQADNVVLEIGCEWGTTTVLIAPRCKLVVGTDVSPDCIARARQRHPEIRFEVLDGFDVLAALRLGESFTKVYIDMSGLSGYRSLLDAIALLQAYATVLRPQTIVIKSAALKHFASHCQPWWPGQGSPAGQS
ncbi:MAG: class I SAM-dependent methyltransferase [Phycisphaerae bacterium]|nr:class I SAM-dependent methyltransferase [Phycisphaerae bacterium]